MKMIILLACAVVLHAHVSQHNYGLGNTRLATDSTITATNVGGLSEAWRFTTAGDVMGQATTATVNGVDVVFFADAAGWIYCLSLSTGGQIWKTNAGSITGITGSFSRNAPAFYNNRIYLGDQKSAYFWALDASSGALVWKTLLDPHPMALVTQSPTVDNGNVYVGCSSTDGGGPEITFRGFLSRLDADTGAVIWKKFMTPTGYAGVAVWGSSPALDYSRNTVYCTTGNNYDLPQSVIECINGGGGKACMASDNYVDSIVALDIDTGDVRWSFNYNGVDYWNIQLCPNQNNCGPNYKDFDFGQGPMLFTVNGVDAVGAGQKGGLVHAVNRDNGQILWTKKVGEGTSGGGMLFGSSVDEKYIYVGNTNNWGQPWTLVDGSVCAGFQGYWSALDKNTGDIVWQVCNPTGAKTNGPLTSTPGGLMFAGSLDSAGKVYALRSSDGEIMWQSELGGSVGSGAALTGSYLIWGGGYSKWSIASPGRRITAFLLAGGSSATNPVGSTTTTTAAAVPTTSTTSTSTTTTADPTIDTSGSSIPISVATTTSSAPSQTTSSTATTPAVSSPVSTVTSSSTTALVPETTIQASESTTTPAATSTLASDTTTNAPITTSSNTPRQDNGTASNSEANFTVLTLLFLVTMYIL